MCLCFVAFCDGDTQTHVIENLLQRAIEPSASVYQKPGAVVLDPIYSVIHASDLESL